MTANRWWVRLAARWLARVDGVNKQVQMFSLAVTAFSTFSLLLQNAGFGRYVPHLGVVTSVAFVVYTYYYNEGGVRNQVSRDRQDLSNNWAGPNSKIQGEMFARAYLAGERGRELSDEEREAIRAESFDTFREYRDGFDLEGAD